MLKYIKQYLLLKYFAMPSNQKYNRLQLNKAKIKTSI